MKTINPFNPKLKNVGALMTLILLVGGFLFVGFMARLAHKSNWGGGAAAPPYRVMTAHSPASLEARVEFLEARCAMLDSNQLFIEEAAYRWCTNQTETDEVIIGTLNVHSLILKGMKDSDGEKPEARIQEHKTSWIEEADASAMRPHHD